MSGVLTFLKKFWYLIIIIFLLGVSLYEAVYISRINSALQLSIAGTDADKERITRELSDLRKSLDAANSIIGESKSTIGRQQQIISDLETTKRNLQDTNIRLTELRKQLELSVGRQQETISGLESTKRGLESTNIELTKTNSELATARGNLQTINDKLTIINQQFKNTVGKQQITISELESTKQRLELANSGLAETNKRLESTVTDLIRVQQESGTTNNEIRNLTEDCLRIIRQIKDQLRQIDK